MTHQQHLQMGLRKGMAILIYYVIGDTHYQAVLLAEESVMNRGRRGENRLWKRVTPAVTEFAWLPPNLAESFCKNALYRDDVRTYCAFDTHLGLDTKNFVADVFVENILYLGDTRSADDLSVFTKMAPERLCLGCGLRVDEPFAPISTGERKKLFYAAQKLLTFVLHEVSAQTLSEEETALKIALRPLIINKDGHFVDEPLINRVQVILRATMGGRSVSSEEGIVTLQLLCQLPYHEELPSTACSVALVVLWMGLHQEKFPLLATTLQAAAGVSGPQKWALILPGSARVSLVTYTAVIAVRYPELDNVQNDLICFGNYLLGEQATSGGFLPLFWDAPSAYMHAATDIGSAVDWLQSQVELSSDENGCLAVLHNRNKMVATFGNSEWVTQSDGAVQSKSVTSCAGMTAHFVLLAQTKVGFLSGGRSRHRKEL